MASGALPSGGGGGSPSGHAGSDRGAASASVSTPASESTVARRLNGLDLQGDDAPSSQPVARFVSPMRCAIPLLLKFVSTPYSLVDTSGELCVLSPIGTSPLCVVLSSLIATIGTSVLAQSVNSCHPRHADSTFATVCCPA
jgi:hypothetical protein